MTMWTSTFRGEVFLEGDFCWKEQLMRPVPVRLAAVLVAACVSCSSITSVARGADSAFAGTWVQRAAAAGTSFVFTLAVEGAKVTGTGSYSTEGGRSGTITESGS